MPVLPCPPFRPYVRFLLRSLVVSSPLSALFELASSLYLGVVCCCPQKIFNGATSQQRPLGAASTIGGLIERGVLREANRNTIKIKRAWFSVLSLFRGEELSFRYRGVDPNPLRPTRGEAGLPGRGRVGFTGSFGGPIRAR